VSDGGAPGVMPSLEVSSLETRIDL
jgi:hypothetical protein